MKKTRATALLLASVMAFTCVPGNVVLADDAVVSESSVAVAEVATSDAAASAKDSEASLEAMALEGWVAGWTGVADQEKKVSIKPTDDGVNIRTLAAGTGKFQSAEDSIAYYVYEIPSTADFKLSATVTVNGYNSLGSTNPQQTSFGLTILDDLYSRAAVPPKAYTNNFMLASYMTKSAATAASISATHRYNGVRTIDTDLITGLNTSTTVGGIGPFEMTISKSGSIVKVSVNGNEYSYNTDELATNAAIPYFSDTIYTGFYATRDADVTFSNVQYEVETRTVETLELISAPEKTEYVVGDTINLGGLEVKAYFTDGSSEMVDDYAVYDFDTETKGDKVMRIEKGGKSLEIPYTVLPVMCSDIKVTTMPVYSDYYIGQRFELAAFEAEAEYNNGTKAVLSSEECMFFVNGEQIKEGYYFTADDVGKKTVTVKHAVTDSVEESAASDTFTISVEDYTMSGIAVGNLPTRTKYAPNTDVDPTGMTVRGVYTNAAGENRYAFLSEDEYEVLDADTSALGTTPVTVRYIKNPEFTTTFNVEVITKIPVAFQLKHYPRTTYQVGEEFTTEGMKPVILYNSDDVEVTDQYTVDLSKFDSSAVGKTSVTIIPNNESFQPIELAVTITNEKTHYWKSTAFGASATTSANTAVETRDENGNVTSVNVRSWNGAGKITKDHDGMSYYYTRVDANNNFTITADITVNDYLEHDNSDENRSGQEAFGIMARDVIPLNPDMDKLDEYEIQEINDAIGTKNYIPMTVNSEKAVLDENGEPEPALEGKNNYKVTFSSNMAILGGYSGTSWPNDPSALSYQKNATINRINLVMRSGVYHADASSSIIEKHGPYKLSDTFPARGNKYRVTLTRINGGLYAKCYDYQTGEVKETYQYAEDNEELKNLFTRQDSKSLYVGFFAARWADITVSDFELHETNTETDPITNNGEDEASTPAIKLQSSQYTTSTNYNLSLRATNKLGGYVTIQQNGKIVYRDEPVSKNSIMPVTLEPNSVNNFTVLYKPNPSDNITSSDDVIAKFTVTHRDSLGDYDVLYCAPDGKVTGDGTRENPLDVYSAVGFVDLGKEVVALEGTYKMTQAFSIPVSNTGVASAWKTLRADDGATVTFDMQHKYEGMTLDGYYWHIKGIDFTNSGDNLKPFLLAGNHCIIEDCKFYNNGDTGFQVSRSSDSNINIDMWPEYNVIRDCESYNNCDPAKINADGFGLKLTVGYGNIFERCISHNNLDDGYDSYTKKGEGAIGPVTLDHCVAYDNGNKLNEDGTTTSYAGGGNNGFKMGGESVPVQHYLKDCIAFENGANGVTTNSNPALKIRNFVAYKNSGRGVYLYTGDGQRNFDYDVKGVVSYQNSSPDQVDAKDIDVYVQGKIAAADGTTEVKMPAVIADYVSPELLTEFKSVGGVLDDSEKGNVWPMMVNHSTISVNNETNYWSGKNCDGDVVTDEFFKSVDKNDVLTKGLYSQDEDGKFILGDFLARADEYVHDAEDEVIYPEGPKKTTENTETTTEGSTETTTKRPSSNGGGGSSSGSSSSGNSSSKASGIAPETTTVDVEEETTERTTVEAKSFVTPSGVVITPPVNTGIKVNFTDISNRAWAVESINKLAAAGIVNGVSADKFAPDAYSKRADFIVMLVKTFGLTGPATDNFDDVAAGKYYADALAIAKTAGIATGYGDGNFGPEKTITRQDMMVLVAKALEFAGIELDTDTAALDKYADADKVADYAKPYVAALINAGLASGTDNGIEPLALITRAQMSVLVANVYDVVLDAAENYAQAEEEEVSEETTEAAEAEETNEETTEEVTEAE